jgi:YegS/Rv2252/BmrU family lipid kinase
MNVGDSARVGHRLIVTNRSLLFDAVELSPILRRMKRTTACLVVHPRSGHNLARVPEVVAVLAAAGWTTDVVVKESKGQTMELAGRAAEAGYDFVIAYGGDGTVNHVINGVLAFSGKRHAAVGVIPGGTANVWAAEVGIPADPVQAARSLVESNVRHVDVGHVGVDSVSFGDGSAARNSAAGSAAGARRYFLLMAGLGVDAAVMGRTSTALKHKLGVAAVALTAVKMLPALKTYLVEIRSGENAALVWEGRALQLVVGNTQLYGKVARMTPDALLDSGELDLSVITARNSLSAFMQVVAVLLRGRPTHAQSKAARSAHFLVSAPASVDLQLDGSAVKLKKYLTEPAREALERAGDLERVRVAYRFEAVAAALRMAVPREYDGRLFRGTTGERVETSGEWRGGGGSGAKREGRGETSGER